MRPRIVAARLSACSERSNQRENSASRRVFRRFQRIESAASRLALKLFRSRKRLLHTLFKRFRSHQLLVELERCSR
jgi:hypothetical protein